jgi:hypothetical protein
MLNLLSLMYLHIDGRVNGVRQAAARRFVEVKHASGGAAGSRGASHDGHAGNLPDAPLKVLRATAARCEFEDRPRAAVGGKARQKRRKRADLVARGDYETSVLRAAVYKAIIGVADDAESRNEKGFRAGKRGAYVPLCWHGSRSKRASRAIRSATLYLEPSFSSSAITQSLREEVSESRRLRDACARALPAVSFGWRSVPDVYRALSV